MQGPHQGAQKSTITGTSLFSTSASKVASDTCASSSGASKRKEWAKGVQQCFCVYSACMGFDGSGQTQFIRLPPPPSCGVVVKRLRCCCPTIWCREGCHGLKEQNALYMRALWPFNGPSNQPAEGVHTSAALRALSARVTSRCARCTGLRAKAAAGLAATRLPQTLCLLARAIVLAVAVPAGHWGASKREMLYCYVRI